MELQGTIAGFEYTDTKKYQTKITLKNDKGDYAGIMFANTPEPPPFRLTDNVTVTINAQEK